MSLKQTYDDDFLSLLSAQREILKRLKREKSVAPKVDALVSAPKMRETRTISTTTSARHGLFATTDSDPFCLMNEPIIERHPAARDESTYLLQTCPSASATDYMNSNGTNRIKKITPMNLFQMDKIPPGRSAARRNSLSGMIADALAFGDIDSTATRMPKEADAYNPKTTFGKMVASKEGFMSKKVFDSNNIDSAALRREFVNFIVAMEKSMKSQQDIHDWDRKMGLKRSHSKTMRLSMRSRNRLRKVVVNV